MSDHRWCPDKCPITGRPFFCWIEDEDGSQVPTYGGPFDSYTLPEQDENGEFTVKHYDHDLGGWRDYMNLGLRLIDDQREDHEWGTVEALQARIAEQDAAIALMRGQSEVAGYQRRCTIYDGHVWHEVTRELYEMAKTNPALTRDYEYRIVYSISTPPKDTADEQ